MHKTEKQFYNKIMIVIVAILHWELKREKAKQALTTFIKKANNATKDLIQLRSNGPDNLDGELIISIVSENCQPWKS